MLSQGKKAKFPEMEFLDISLYFTFNRRNNCSAMSAATLKGTKRWFSSLNHQNFEFFCLVPRSPTHTGLICVVTLEPNISSLGPFNKFIYRVLPLYTHQGVFFPVCALQRWAKWRLSTFDLYPGVQGQICDILRPQLAMNRFLPLLATQIPTLWIHTSGGRGLWY